MHEVAQSPSMYLIHPLITHSLFIFLQVPPRQLDSASSNLRIFSRSRGTSVSHRFSPFLYPRLSRFLWPAGIPMIFSTIPFGPFLSGCCWLASRPRLEAAVARLQFFHFFGHSFPCSVWPVGSASFPPWSGRLGSFLCRVFPGHFVPSSPRTRGEPGPPHSLTDSRAHLPSVPTLVALAPDVTSSRSPLFKEDLTRVGSSVVRCRFAAACTRRSDSIVSMIELCRDSAVCRGRARPRHTHSRTHYGTPRASSLAARTLIANDTVIARAPRGRRDRRRAVPFLRHRTPRHALGKNRNDHCSMISPRLGV